MTASQLPAPAVFARARRARAYIVVKSAHGVVDVDLHGQRFAGVLDAPGGVVEVGDVLALTILGHADSASPALGPMKPQVSVLVTAIDDADRFGRRQMLGPGTGVHVELSGAELEALFHAAARGAGTEPGPGEQEEDDDDDEDVITGPLRRMPLAELVQALGFARRTATIRLRVRGAGTGAIHLAAGEVAAAQLGVERGAVAFGRMLACTRGTFRVSFDDAPVERNVYGATQMLILDALRQLDEARRDAREAEDVRGDGPICVDDGDIVFDLPDDGVPLELEEVYARRTQRPARART